MNDATIQGYIKSPAELDIAARYLDRALARTPSPQKRFLLITEFWSHTEALPRSWVSSYLLPLAPSFIELLYLPSLSNLSANIWRNAYAFLHYIEEQKFYASQEELSSATAFAIEHVIRSHAYVSALRELHQFLLQYNWLDRALDAAAWTAVFAASTTAFGLFKSYVTVLQEHEAEKAVLFTAVLEQWRDFRNRDHALAVIMLETDGEDRYAAGRVLLMDVLPRVGQQGEDDIHNQLGDQGHETLEQIKRAQRIAGEMIAVRFGKTPPELRYQFSVPESSALIVGGSLGCAVTAGIAARQTQYLNFSERWTLPSTVSCVGSLAADGTLEAGQWHVIEKKLRVAFSSPLEKIGIPAVHREAALLFVQQLQREYPNRRLEVFGLSNVRELLDMESIIIVTRRGRAERIGEYARRHSVPLLLLLVVVLFGGGGYFAYRAFYDYPNLEHARGLVVGTGSIVYNPKDSLIWCFRDGERVVSNRITFGDIEVGDGFTRQFHIWNMTPVDQKIRISIEGADAGDWYTTQGGDPLHVPSAGSALVAVMFAPRNEGMQKEAELVLRDARTEKRRYALLLQASAGRPLSAGYALRFDGIDDQLHFGQRSTAFDLTATASRQATFECWLRPTAPLRNMMILHNGQRHQDAPDIEDLFLGFISPDTLYYRVGSVIRMFVLTGNKVAAVGDWTHLALAISLPQRRIAVYINGEEIDNSTVDILFDGPGMPFVTIGARNTGKSSDLHFQGDMDEIRLWHTFRSATQMRHDMHRRVSGLAAGLAGYWDMDMATENIAFNANKFAHSGALLYRPALIRSDLALEKTEADVRLVADHRDGSALELQPGRYLVCFRPVLPPRGPASFAFRFYEGEKQSIHFNYVLRNQGWISIESNMLFTMEKKLPHTIAPGWHLGVCTVTAEGQATFYLDGEILSDARTVPEGGQNWHQRFEGMMLGFRFDREQQLASKYYDWYYPTLSHSRTYQSLHVWSRLLRPSEIAGMHTNDTVPGDELVASWTLDRLPDRNNNISDTVAGHHLHIKKVLGWR
ncbi:MAG: hypothetical protein KFH87_07445 [Bacteroidetes bacterium]|nr:hypothetical protein [Bacteroidota bacterium]